MGMSFVHLHLHTHYSLLDGLTKVPALVELAKKQGAKALAITDHGVMYGAVEFYKECKKQDIKPIVGVEVYITQGKLTDRELKRGEKNYYHLTLLAKNHQGYVNLMKLTTEAHTKGFYYRPRIDHETLTKYADNLICMSGCLNGEVHQTILAGQLDKAKEIILWHKQLFGDDYYLELQDHPNIPEQKIVNDALIGLSQELGVPLVATTDSHYLNADDADAQDVLLCVQTGARVEDTKRMSMMGEVFDLKTPEYMAEAFKHVPEAIVNTVKIADKCDLEIPMGKLILPAFNLPEGETIDSYIDKQIKIGVQKRFGNNPSKEVLERVDFEMSVIRQMGYQAYMLIVADFIVWAKSQGIMVGPGRGSAAGSMVSYVLTITDVNPLEHGLLFERFLNPERISMPDIDIDIADDRRSEVIDYVVKKYGRKQVAQIITFGTMASRAAVRDVGRVLSMGYGDVDRIAKMIPPPQQGKYTSLKQHIENVHELRSLYEASDENKKLLNLAIKLEGTIRHASVHAAGVVIGDRDLTNYVPLQFSPSGDETLVTQYSMYPIEDIGLLKMDFLGLKNLTIIKNAVRIIRKVDEQKIDVNKLPFDDEKTFELLRAGNTTGIFQLEGEGMTKYLKELGPTIFSDIAAMIALYRPGPIELIPDFIARKKGQKKIEYLHPKLEPILKDTYGIAVFQEQVLQIARDLCGFTLGQADVLRKAIGKKIPKLLAEQKGKFLQGALDNGVSEDVANQLFHFVEPFALYGFNRAHATSYATITYWTAYLKAHFPHALMAALMTSDRQDLDKIARDIAECDHVGMKVLAPSVNKSFTDFAVDKETKEIVFGLNTIKNVGRKVSDLIADERQANGKYKSLTDFIKRAGHDVVNKKTMESLIMAGGLDEFEDRRVLLDNLDYILAFANDYHRRLESQQEALFGEAEAGGLDDIKLKVGKEATDQEKLVWERECLGTFVSRHPLKELMPKLVGVVKQINELDSYDDNQTVKIAGVVTRVQKVMTKKGDAMLFVTLEDLGGTIEVIVFPKILEKTENIWERDRIVLVSGRVNMKETTEATGDEIVVVAEPKILASKVTEITSDNIAQLVQINAEEQRPEVQVEASAFKPPLPYEYGSEGLLIKLPRDFSSDKLTQLKQIIEKYPGDRAVILELFSQGKWQTVPTGAKTLESPELNKELEKMLV